LKSRTTHIRAVRLDIDDPGSSEVILPAKHKNELDWDTMNKLANENPDFREFSKRIKIALSSKEIRKEKYDKVYKTEEFIGKLKR